MLVINEIFFIFRMIIYDKIEIGILFLLFLPKLSEYEIYRRARKCRRRR